MYFIIVHDGGVIQTTDKGKYPTIGVDYSIWALEMTLGDRTRDTSISKTM